MRRIFVCQKPRLLGEQIMIIFKVIDWVLFMGFCFLAGHFMKNVIVEYGAKKTSFTQSLEPITKLPTVVICLEKENDFIWVYGKEVNISYMTPNKGWFSLKENKKHDLRDDNEVVEINQFDDNCFKINSTLLKPFQQSHNRWIDIQTTENDTKYMPDYIKVYFTSEENSYGASLDWWDGNVFAQRIDLKKKVLVNLKPFEYRYLGDDSKCSQDSNVARFKTIFKDANFSKCPEKCSPTNYLNDLMPLCGWEDDKIDRCALDSRSLELQLTSLISSKPGSSIVTECYP